MGGEQSTPAVEIRAPARHRIEEAEFDFRNSPCVNNWSIDDAFAASATPTNASSRSRRSTWGGRMAQPPAISMLNGNGGGWVDKSRKQYGGASGGNDSGYNSSSRKDSGYGGCGGQKTGCWMSPTLVEGIAAGEELDEQEIFLINQDSCKRSVHPRKYSTPSGPDWPPAISHSPQNGMDISSRRQLSGASELGGNLFDSGNRKMGNRHRS